MLLLAQTIA